MPPAQQRLETDDVVVLHTHLRLVGQLELALGQCDAKIVLQRSAGLERGIHVHFEGEIASAAIRLCTVECEVGVTKQFLVRVAVGGCHRDADADADMNDVAVDLERGCKCIDHAPRRFRGFREATGHDHGELVAAETREGLAGPDLAPQPRGDGTQQGIPDRMTVRVVDRLEAVEIEAEHDARPASDRLVEPLAQQGRFGSSVSVS